VKTSSERMIFLMVVYAVLSFMLAASCKAIDVPDKYPPMARNSTGIVKAVKSPARFQNQTQAQAQTATQAAPSNSPSFEEMITPDMKRFIMVYQTLMEGETEPCG